MTAFNLVILESFWSDIFLPVGTFSLTSPLCLNLVKSKETFSNGMESTSFAFWGN